MTKRAKIIRDIFAMHPWNCAIVFQAGGSKESFFSHLQQLLKKQKVKTKDIVLEDETVSALLNIDCHGFVVRITNRDLGLWLYTTNPGSGLAAHEAFHAAKAILEDCNVKLDALGAEEAWAYTIEDIVKKIGNKVWP